MYSLLKLLENSYYTAEYDRDENGNIVFEIEVPGFNKDNLNVEITDGFLTVRGETEKRQYFKQFTLNNVEDVSATIKDGILTLTLSEPEKQVRKIELNKKEIEYTDI